MAEAQKDSRCATKKQMAEQAADGGAGAPFDGQAATAIEADAAFRKYHERGTMVGPRPVVFSLALTHPFIPLGETNPAPRVEAATPRLRQADCNEPRGRAASSGLP
jgi:hypothetical protein